MNKAFAIICTVVGVVLLGALGVRLSYVAARDCGWRIVEANPLSIAALTGLAVIFACLRLSRHSRARSFFAGERTYGGLRCPTCGYDTSRVPGSVCPECGISFLGSRPRSVPRWMRRLVRPRAEGHRHRCHSCGYDIGGVNTTVCPECGNSIMND